MAEIEAQLPGARRVHRSFLVNSKRVETIKGNSRKRSVTLLGSDREVEVYSRFVLTLLPFSEPAS